MNQHSLVSPGACKVFVTVRGEQEMNELPLFLAPGKTTRSKSGHIMMGHLRTALHGPPENYNIMYQIRATEAEGDTDTQSTTDTVVVTPQGKFYSRQDGLTSAQFPPDCELVIWLGGGIHCSICAPSYA